MWELESLLSSRPTYLYSQETKPIPGKYIAQYQCTMQCTRTEKNAQKLILGSPGLDLSSRIPQYYAFFLAHIEATQYIYHITCSFYFSAKIDNGKFQNIGGVWCAQAFWPTSPWNCDVVRILNWNWPAPIIKSVLKKNLTSTTLSTIDK